MALAAFYALLNYLHFLNVLTHETCQVLTPGYAGNGGVIKGAQPYYEGNCLAAWNVAQAIHGALIFT